MPGFKWERGSIAMFDNRACQHFASVDYIGYLRRGTRVTISGDKPFYDRELESNLTAGLSEYGCPAETTEKAAKL